MKPKEKDFCRWMAVCGEPERAARLAGYRHFEERWPRLLCREDIAEEIRSNTRMLRGVYENTALCGLYRTAFGNTGNALRLLYHEEPSDRELDTLDLSSVAEIKRTKDKSVEIKFFDRIKAFEKMQDIFNSSEESKTAGSLLEAMRLSAQALSLSAQTEGEADGD